MSTTAEKTVPASSAASDRPAKPEAQRGDSMSHYADIVRAVKTPLGLFSLSMLVSVPTFSVFLWNNKLESEDRTIFLTGMLGLMFVIVFAVVAIALVRPEVLGIRTSPKAIRPEPRLPLRPAIPQDLSDAGSDEKRDRRQYSDEPGMEGDHVGDLGKRNHEAESLATIGYRRLKSTTARPGY